MNYSDANSFVEKGFPFTLQCMSYDLANGCTLLTDDASNHKVVMKIIHVDASKGDAKESIEACIDSTIIASKCVYLSAKNLLFITMPYYEKGNFELLVKNTSFIGNEELYKNHFTGIANGLKELGEHYLIHGNLKPSNILSDSTNTESHLVLTDSSLYQFFESPFKVKSSTLFYSAPEILNNSEITVAADLWSFGCILYFAITGGVHLFQADSIGLLYQKISNSAHPKLPKDCPNYIKDLIDLLILNDANRRIPLSLIIDDLAEEKSKSFLIEQMEPESAVKGVLGKYENPEMTVEEMMKDLDDFKEDYESVRLIILEIAKNSELKKKLIMEYNKSNEEQYYRVLIQLCFEAPLIKETITGKLLIQNPTELKIVKGIKDDYEWNLYFKVIEDEGIKHLLKAAQYMPYTEKLCLGSNKITVNGVKMLVERFDLFPDLSLLDIGYNPFGDEGATLIGNHLCDIPCLTDLYLSNCKIGNEGVKVISKGLLNCPDLVKIDLGSNLITDEGAKYLSVSIKSLARLEKVNMGRNNLSSQGKAILSDCSIDKPNLTVLV